MSTESSSGLPRHGRLAFAATAVAVSIGLVANHFAPGAPGTARLMLLAVGPTALFLAIGGIVEPKIVFSIGRHGKDLPVVYKVIGGILGALGVIVTLLWVFFVYPLGRPY